MNNELTIYSATALRGAVDGQGGKGASAARYYQYGPRFRIVARRGARKTALLVRRGGGRNRRK
jgi:hypothetical protein